MVGLWNGVVWPGGGGGVQWLALPVRFGFSKKCVVSCLAERLSGFQGFFAIVAMNCQHGDIDKLGCYV
jgi:hypothetical protein